MTQEDANLMYNENTWGMYRFNLHDKEVMKDLLNINERNSKDTMLQVVVNAGHLQESEDIFDVSEVSIYIFYKCRNLKLNEEICRTCNNKWSDTDSYDLSDKELERIKSEEVWSRQTILNLLKMDSDFKKLVTTKVLC